jgi:hypothetical protein
VKGIKKPGKLHPGAKKMTEVNETYKYEYSTHVAEISYIKLDHRLSE